MYEGTTVGVVIPARDEAGNIGTVVGGLLELREDGGGRIVDDLVVCDNGSTDGTAARAREAGARVVVEKIPGYGRACLAAIAALRPVDVILFVDGDRSCREQQARDLLRAIATGADLVIGSRVLGQVERGALSLPQIAGNRVASVLIRLLWGRQVTDLGPFRAIRTVALHALDMRDTAYGWTVEMQIKAIRKHLRVVEVPVDSLRRRSGRSKVGGTVRGVIGASIGILYSISRLYCRRPPARRSTGGCGGARS